MSATYRNVSKTNLNKFMRLCTRDFATGGSYLVKTNNGKRTTYDITTTFWEEDEHLRSILNK